MRHRPFQVCVSLSLSMWMGLALPWASWAETDWYALKANGQIIGKVGIHSYPAPEGGAGIVTEVSNVNHFTRQGSPFEVNAVSRFVESVDDHKPLSFSYSYNLGEQQLLAAEGSLKNNALDLRMQRENGESAGQAEVTGEQFLFPGGEGIKQVYRQHYADRQGARFSYQTLHLGVRPQLVNTEVTSLEREKLALATGEVKAVRKYELINPAAREKKIYEWRDAQGKLYQSRSVGEGGMEMVYASQLEVRNIDQNTVDLVNASAVLSNAIPQPRITTEALYKISPLAGRSLDMKSLFPESLTQTVVLPNDAPSAAMQEIGHGDTVYLKVRQKEPADSLVPFPIAYDRQYLQETPYLQVSDPQLDQIALAVAGKESRAYYAARQLREWVYKNIAYKDLTLGFASAKETFQRRQGDCTEHAVLLASLLRSLGIPSRVAIGLIYLPDQDSTLGRFVFHMWTEAYIGNRQQGDWVPLDATNPEALTDATHIKLADSTLSDVDDLTRLTEQVVNVMGKVRLDVVKAVSPSQSVLSVEDGAGITAVEIPQIDITRFDIQALSRQAIKHFRVDLPPASLSTDSANGLFTIGLEAQSQGNAAQAKRYFGQSLAKLRHPVEFYQMGERLLAVGQYDLAKQAFLAAKTKDEALAPLVANWMSAGIPESALSAEQAALFELAIALQAHPSENGEDSCSLLKTLARQGVGKFFPVYRSLGENCDGPEGSQALLQALAINPDDFQSAELLGDWYLAHQRYADARQAYLDALGMIAGKPFAQSRPWVEDLAGKMEIAAGSARLSRNKKDAQGWLHVGKGLQLQHRNEDALSAFQNALIIQPGMAEAATRRFQLALEQYDWAYLSAHQGQIASIAGSQALAARVLGRYFMRIRNYGSALSYTQKAIVLSPGHGEAYDILSQIYNRLATQAAWQKPPLGPKNVKLYQSKAEAALKRGIALTRNATEKNHLALTLGALLLERNRPQEAEPYADQVIAADPLNGRAHWLKGKVLFFAGSDEQARNELKTALILLPNDPDTLVGLGQIAEEEGRDALAMDYYQKAYKADGANYDAGQCLRHLMNKLQVAGKRPPDFMRISDDEHDFLVRLLDLDTRVQQATSWMTARLGFLDQDNGNGFNLQQINKVKRSILLMEQSYNAQLQLYKQGEAMKAPPRFAELRYIYLTMQRGLLDYLNEAITGDGFFSPELAKKKKVEAQQKYEKLVSLQTSGAAAMQRILGRLSKTELRGIASESGMGDKDFVAELARTKQEMAKRLEAEKSGKSVTKGGQEIPVSNTGPAQGGKTSAPAKPLASGGKKSG